MNLRLEGKLAVITGGSKGIGLACARAFLEEGARVALLSRDPANLASARASLGRDVFTRAVDLADAEAAKRAFAEVSSDLGPVDVLVNSAGAARRHPPLELDAAAWRQAIDAKFFPTVNAMDAVLPGMAARGSGAVVNIIGVGGKVADPFHIAGGAANAALMLATKGLAVAYAPRGVRINGINPGMTKTGRVKDRLDVEARTSGCTQEQLLRKAESRIPAGRMATPEEVAQAALFLASGQAGYIFGVVLPMDGAANPVI
jgi:NAD(P)-dependent dehydrogenase (short-subunit alcohol dehydrogenase family)